MFSIEKLDVIDIAYRFKSTGFHGNYTEKMDKYKKYQCIQHWYFIGYEIL